MSVEPTRRYFNISDYYRMIESGILSETDRVELIDGEVIEMSPIGSRHAACVDRLGALLHRRLAFAVIVRVQNPVRLDEYSEPQPDIALLRHRDDFYEREHPTPDDVLLVIEVADTSLEYDRAVKVPLYAGAEIAEAWVVDLVRDAVEIYSQPEDGVYKETRQFARGQKLVSRQIESLELSVEEILG